MLGYIFTDAAVAPALLQDMLSEATGGSFNSITVDSDTSTSDTVLLFATGQAGNATTDHARRCGRRCALRRDPRRRARPRASGRARRRRGVEVHRDPGERAPASDDSAKRVALAIANSPLVKTAIAGEDANWGRVVMAVGKAGEPADRDRARDPFRRSLGREGRPAGRRL